MYIHVQYQIKDVFTQQECEGLLPSSLQLSELVFYAVTEITKAKHQMITLHFNFKRTKGEIVLISTATPVTCYNNLIIGGCDENF